jgi:hypothetical protein
MPEVRRDPLARWSSEVDAILSDLSSATDVKIKSLAGILSRAAGLDRLRPGKEADVQCLDLVGGEFVWLEGCRGQPWRPRVDVVPHRCSPGQRAHWSDRSDIDMSVANEHEPPCLLALGCRLFPFLCHVRMVRRRDADQGRLDLEEAGDR